MSVTAYHPETGHTVEVDDVQLAHLRISGWMLRSEWEEQRAAQAAAAAPAPVSTAAKTAKTSTDEGK